LIYSNISVFKLVINGKEKKTVLWKCTAASS